MIFNIATYDFEVINTKEEIENKPGVCVVVDNVNGKYELVDILNSSDIHAEIDDHPNTEKWKEISRGNIEYAVHYTHFRPREQKTKNMEIEVSIRNQYNFKVSKTKHKVKRPYRLVSSEVEE